MTAGSKVCDQHKENHRRAFLTSITERLAFQINDNASLIIGTRSSIGVLSSKVISQSD